MLRQHNNYQRRKLPLFIYAALAKSGVRFIPHGWNTALGLASDLHLASASRNTDMVEYLTGSPFIDDLVEARWKLDSDGMLPVPDGAGLGICLNMDAVEKHTGQRFGPAA